MYRAARTVHSATVSRLEGCARFALALLLSGCASGEAFVPLDDQGATTFILASSDDEDSSWTFIVGTREDSPVLRVPAESSVLLLLYDETPESLGLRGPGPVSCRVLQPRAGLRLASDGAMEAAAVTIPRALVAALVGGEYRCELCPPFEITSVSNDRSGRFTGAAWLDENNAIVSADHGFSRVTETSIEALGECEGLTQAPRALANAGSGRFWVAGGSRQLSLIRFEADGARCIVETSTTMARSRPGPGENLDFQAIAARPDDPAAHDLMAVRGTGEVFRWDTTGLRRIGRMENHPNAAEHLYASLLRLDAERSITSSGWNQVYLWSGDVLERQEHIDLPSDAIATQPKDRITTLAYDTLEERLVLGSLYGDVWVRPVDGREWSSVFQSSLVDAIGSVIPLTRRYVIVHEGGELTYTHREIGGCPTLTRLPLARRSAPGRVTLARGRRIMIADLAGSDAVPGAAIWIEDPSSPQ